MKINANEISEYIISNAKQDEVLGIEIEHFILDENQRSVFYSYENDKAGVREILEELSANYKEKIYEEFEGNKNLVGLKRDDVEISIEPGAQLEVSIHYSDDIDVIESAYEKFLDEINVILCKHKYQLLNIGYRPDACAMEVPIIPKMRYWRMDANFKTVDDMGCCMMRCSAATQVTIDFKDEEDCMKKLKIATVISPIFYFLLDNSPIFEKCYVGKKQQTPSGYQNPKRMARWQIWNNADNDRCTSLECVFENEKNAREYIDNYSEAITSLYPVYSPEKLSKTNQIKHELSMCFFDARLKNAIEIRPADSMPKEYTFAYLHLIKALFYNEAALSNLWNVFSTTSFDDYKKAGQELQEKGWDAWIYGHKVKSILDIIIDIADCSNNKKIKPIKQLIDKKTCLKDHLKHKYKLKKVDFNPISKTQENTDIQINYFHENKGCMPDRNEFFKLRQKSLVSQHGKISNTAYISKVFSTQTIMHFETILDKLNCILKKVIVEYYNNPEYAKLWHFDKFSKHLIDFVPQYNQVVPIARYDVFYDDVTCRFQFCEFNTGGAAAMGKTTFANNEIKTTQPFQKIQLELNRKNRQINDWDLFGAWVKEFIKIYDEWAENTDHKTSNMSIAMVDFLDNCQIEDFEPFCDAFKDAGYDCEICDIRDLRYNGFNLINKEGKSYDAIYKRVTMDDLINFQDDSGVLAMVTAVLNDKVCPIDWFNTQIVHDKQLFAILRHPKTQKLLTKSEKSFIEKTIPQTWIIDEKIAKDNTFVDNKNKYIIKPISSRDSKNIYPGLECNKVKWSELIKSFSKDKKYIIQKYCKIYTSENLCFDVYNEEETLESDNYKAIKQYSNMDGLFCYNGYFVGMYLREGDHSKKATLFDMTVPSFYESRK